MSFDPAPELEDPIFRAMNKTGELFAAAVKFARSDEREPLANDAASKELYTLGATAHEESLAFWRTIGYARLRSDASSESSLSVLLGNLSEVVKAYDRAYSALETALVELVPEQSPRDRQAMLQTVADNHRQTMALIKRATPNYLTLTSHFEMLLEAGPEWDQEEGVTHIELFAPLSALREEYLLKPRRDLLVDYLAAVESLKANEEYFGTKQLSFDLAILNIIEKLLEERTLELEVASLLDVLEHSHR